MRKMAMSITEVVLAKVPMLAQVEARAVVDDTIVSAAAVEDGITVPHGKGAFHHALIDVHKPPLLLAGLPRSHLSSRGKMKVSNIMSALHDGAQHKMLDEQHNLTLSPNTVRKICCAFRVQSE